MALTDRDRFFLAKRKRMTRSWPLMGSLLLVVLVALVAWLFYQAPTFVNPFAVMSRLESNAIEQSTLGIMAGMLPVVVLLCFLVLFMLVLFAFAAFSNERKLIRIIDSLEKEQDPVGGRVR